MKEKVKKKTDRGKWGVCEKQDEQTDQANFPSAHVAFFSKRKSTSCTFKWSPTSQLQS